jgi:hypothetical protein
VLGVFLDHTTNREAIVVPRASLSWRAWDHVSRQRRSLVGKVNCGGVGNAHPPRSAHYDVGHLNRRGLGKSIWDLGFGASLDLGTWCLGFSWDLGFGVWDFHRTPRHIYSNRAVMLILINTRF